MKTIFKWFTTVILTLFMLAPASFASTQNGALLGQQVTEAGQLETIAATTGTTHLQNGNTLYYRGSYHSGSRAPSSRVSGSRYSGSHAGTTYGSTGRSLFGSGFGSHMFSFGAGWFLGSMFHPFGGYYGVGYHSFSLIGILFDILIIWIIWRIIRRIFR